MKGIAGPLVGAVVLALVATAVLMLGLLDRQMASARQGISSLRYDAADQSYDAAERYFAGASYVPWIGNGPVNHVRARKAALKYWKGDFGQLAAGQNDSMLSIPPDNVELQFVVASAIYRAGQAKAKDRATSLQALDAGIGAFRTVIRNSKSYDDAAYNFEYLTRLKDEFNKGRRGALPKFDIAPDGTAGSQPDDAQLKDDLKMYAPLDGEERTKSGLAGKSGPKARKG